MYVNMVFERKFRVQVPFRVPALNSCSPSNWNDLLGIFFVFA